MGNPYRVEEVEAGALVLVVHVPRGSATPFAAVARLRAPNARNGRHVFFEAVVTVCRVVLGQQDGRKRQLGEEDVADRDLAFGSDDMPTLG